MIVFCVACLLVIVVVITGGLRSLLCLAGVCLLVWLLRLWWVSVSGFVVLLFRLLAVVLWLEVGWVMVIWLGCCGCLQVGCLGCFALVVVFLS